MGKSTFNPEWLEDEDFKDWVQEVVRDKYSARCIPCKHTFSLSNMGRQALVSHSKGKNHQQNVKRTSYQITNFFSQPGSAISGTKHY